jgi:hypothetical protein
MRLHEDAGTVATLRLQGLSSQLGSAPHGFQRLTGYFSQPPPQTPSGLERW